MKISVAAIGASLLAASLASSAPIQINYVGATFDAIEYFRHALDPVGYSLRGSYAADDKATASITLGAALPANASVLLFSPTRDLTTGAAIDYTLDVQNVMISDGINTFDILHDLYIETDSGGDISVLEIHGYRGGVDYDFVRINSASGDQVGYYYEYQLDCIYDVTCPSGRFVDAEVAFASTTQAGTWSVSASLDEDLNSVVAAPATAPLPAGGFLLLSGVALALGLQRRRKMQSK